MSTTIINPGESSNSLVIGSYDNLIVSGGTAVDTTVEGGGMSVFLADGLASNTTITSGGTLYASGGNVQNTTLEGSALFSARGTVANSTTVNSGGSFVGHGREFNDTIVNSNGRVDIYGGTVNRLTVNEYGRAFFTNAGTEVNNLVITCGSAYSYTVASATNGVVINTADVQGGFLEVDGGVILNSANLSSSGILNVSGGSSFVQAIDVNDGGVMTIEGNASAYDVTVNYGGYFSAGFGGRGFYGDLSSIGAVVKENGGQVIIGSGNVSNYIEDATGGYYVSSTGVLYPVQFVSNTFSGLVYSDSKRGTVHSGTTALDITALAGGLTVYDGGIVTGYTVTPYTFDSAFEEYEYDDNYNEETQQWESTSSLISSGIRSVTTLGHLNVVAGGTVTGLIAQSVDGYDNGSYLDFQIAPNTVIQGTIDGTPFDLAAGIMSDVSIKDANLTYMDGASVANVNQTCGSAFVQAGASVKNLTLSATYITFSSGAVADGVMTDVVPYTYIDYGFGFGDQDEEPEETIVEGTSGAYVNVLAGATVTGLNMDSQSYLHMQVAPNTVLQGTSGGVDVNVSGGVFASAYLGNTYVEVMGPSSFTDDTAGAAVTIPAGTVTNLVANNGAVVSAYDGSTALEMVENGGAVFVGWDDANPTVTYSFVSNTFSSDYLQGQVTVHKNTIARDNIMYCGGLTVFSGGVLENYYTIGSSTVHDSINIELYDGATVTNLDMVRYSDPGHFHPRWFNMNSVVQINGLRLTDWDGLDVEISNDTNIANGSVDDVPFSVQEGVLSGYYTVATDAPYWDNIRVVDGASVINSYFDTNGTVYFEEGAYGSGNTFARTSAYVYADAELENTTLGLPPVTVSRYGETYTESRAGTIYVSDGGVMRGVTLTNNSNITLQTGAMLTGKVRAEDGSISADEGAIIDFDLTTPDAPYEVRMDNLMTLGNTPKFTITIDAQNQANGQYALTDKINLPFGSYTMFDLLDVSGSTIGYFMGYHDFTPVYGEDPETVLEYLDTFDVNYYAISADQPSFNFSLSMVENSDDDGAYYNGLVFTVDGSVDAPGWLVAPTVTADVITFTNTDVALSVEYSLDAATRQYSLDGQTWTTFPADGAAIVSPVTGDTTTGEIYSTFIPTSEYIPTSTSAYVSGSDGNTTSSYVGEVTGGGISTLTGDDEPTTTVLDDGTAVTTGTNRAVVLIEEEPTTVTETLTVTQNGTVYFRGISADGVVSDVTSFTVSNIDKVAPTAPTDLDSWTTENDDGSVTLTFGWVESTDDYSGIRKYILKYWEIGSTEVITVETPFTSYDLEFPATVAEETAPADPTGADAAGDDGATSGSGDGTALTDTPALATVQVDTSAWGWTVQAVDYAGNVSDVAEYDDGSLPGPELVADVTEPTNGAVNVSIIAAPDQQEEIVDYEYSTDGQENWQAVPESGIVTFTENGVLWVRGRTVDKEYTRVSTLTIDNIDLVAPEAPVAAASTNEITNQDVTVTATFSNDTAVREYSIDGQKWIQYPEDGVVLEDNGKVFFRGTDAAGNISEVTEYEVVNIDKVAPEAPVASAAAAVGAEGLAVSALFSEDSRIQEYSLDGKEWLAYDGPVIVTEVGTTVFFRGTDAAGNVSTITSYEVASLVPGPDAPVASASITDPTNQNVTVSAVFAEGAAVNEYSMDGRTWTAYTEGIVLEENGTVYFRSADAEGNYSAITSFEVTNIDKVAPEAPVASANITDLTNQDVIVTAVFSNDSVERKYSIVGAGGGEWHDYTEDGVVLSSNDTVLFASEDAAGNLSEMTTFVVSNIDKIPPTAPVASVAASVAAEGLDVSAVFSEDSRIQEYSLDGNEWLAYTGPIVVTEVGTTVYFRGTDAAGNVSEVTKYEVTDLVPGPDAPVASASTTDPTNQDVTVTATFAEGAAVNQYSLNGLDWFDYTEGIVLEENGVVYFRSKDADGRESGITTVTVDNIDKVAPNAPYAYSSYTDMTNQDVTVFAMFSDDSVVRQYAIATTQMGEWLDYTDAGVVLSDNCRVYFRAVDAAGNESEVASIDVSNIDKVAPDAPTASVAAAVDAEGIVVSAAFSFDTVTKEYSLDGQTWQAYTDGILFTELGTVYFRGTDAAGNVSEVTPYEVTTLVLGPAAPTVGASVTELTNEDVLVYAVFGEDTVTKEYSLDGETWNVLETEGVPLAENGTVWFRGLDAQGNASEPASYTVTNIDKVPPAAPTVTASTNDPTYDDVLVSATFSEDSVTKEYSLDGHEWMAYTDPIVFSLNGTVYFRGTDAAGNVSEAVYEVTNIAAANLPDDGSNDVAYDKKAKVWNDANITVENWIGAKDQIVYLDVRGSVEQPVNGIVMHNMVGYNTPKSDTGDAAYLYVEDPAKVTFTVNANMAGTFYVYQRNWDEKKHSYKQVQVGKVSVKAGSAATLKDIALSNSGEYFVQMDANSKAYKKQGATGYYDVKVTSYTPFVDADDGGNNDFSNEAVKANPVAITRDTTIIGLDEGVETAADRNYVGGITDLADYAKLELDSSALLSFKVTADGASDGTAKFSICKYDAKKNKLTKILTSTLKPGKYTQTTKGVFFDKSVSYYLLMESTDAAKGKGVYYKVELNTLGSRFFDSIDTGLNNELYDKKGKKLYADDGKTHRYATNEIVAGNGQTVFLDYEPAGLDDFENYVGYGDKVDYAKFTVATNGTLSFEITAMANATFEVYKFNSAKGKLESLGKAKLALAKNATTCTGTVSGLQLTAGVEYYMSMTAAKTTGNEKGCVYYDVKANFASAVNDAQLDSAVAAAGFASGLESFQDDMSALQDLTKLA